MTTYFVRVQKTHGKNANPANHTAKYIVVADSQEEAEKLVWAQYTPEYMKGIDLIEVIPNHSVYCVVK